MDSVQRKTMIKIGFSAAASWAWGTSLIMGQQIAQEKGDMAFWIWAIANSLTLAIFCWLFKSGKIKKEVYNSKIVKGIALVIQMFCLVVQLNFINEILMDLTHDPTLSYVSTFGIGALFVLMMYQRGLITSIFTDVIQWIIAIATIFVILAVAMWQGVPTIEMATSSGTDIMWGLWSAIVLIAGPIGDVQHWQRAEADTSGKAYYVGAVLFFMYMLLIYSMAHFEFNTLMNVILLITVLCITTSTIDSIAVAMHELGNKKIGTGVCLAICVGWGLLASIGMVSLWSSFGVIRVVFAVAILMLPFCALSKYKVVLTAVGLTTLAIIVFSMLGNIGTDTFFGIACLVVAMVLEMLILEALFRGKGSFDTRG